MEYGNVPGLGAPLSRIVQGTMMLSMEFLDEGLCLCDAVFEAGCNTFDTAHVYGGGDCERVLGEWIKTRGIRDQVVIIDKGAHPNADRNRLHAFDIASDLYDCLARLQTDYIDLFLLHRDDPSLPIGPIVEALDEHRQAGRIRAYGGSNWTHQRLEEANAYAASRGLSPFVASSPHYSLAVQLDAPWDGCVSLTGPEAADARAWYAANGMPVFAWSSLSGGFLSGRHTRASLATLSEEDDELLIRCYQCEENIVRLERARELAALKDVSVPQVALAYLFAKPQNVFTIVGGRAPEEIRANVAALDVVVTAEEAAWLDLRA